MSRVLVWIDSVVMGAVLVVVGLAMCLVEVGANSPMYFGPVLLGILLAVIGVALVVQGLKRRPRTAETVEARPKP